ARNRFTYGKIQIQRFGPYRSPITTQGALPLSVACLHEAADVSGIHPSPGRETTEKPARSPAGVPADPIRHTNGDLHKTFFPESTRTSRGERKGINSALPLRLR